MGNVMRNILLAAVALAGVGFATTALASPMLGPCPPPKPAPAPDIGGAGPVLLAGGALFALTVVQRKRKVTR